MGKKQLASQTVICNYTRPQIRGRATFWRVGALPCDEIIIGKHPVLAMTYVYKYIY